MRITQVIYRKRKEEVYEKIKDCTKNPDTKGYVGGVGFMSRYLNVSRSTVYKIYSDLEKEGKIRRYRPQTKNYTVVSAIEK